MKKQQILGFFGEKAGHKLINWLNSCCDTFCKDVSNCLGISSEGDENLFLNQKGQWTETSGGSTDAWKLTGNAGTDSNTNFVGTSDGENLYVRSGTSDPANEENVYAFISKQLSRIILAVRSVANDIDHSIGILQASIFLQAQEFSTQSRGRILIKKDEVTIDLKEGFTENQVFKANMKTIYCELPEYANDAAADADVDLESKGIYKLTGDRAIYQKP